MSEETIEDAVRALRSGQRSPVELVAAAIARAKRFEHLNAVAFLDEDAALQAARDLPPRPPPGASLHGIPIIVKDLFQVHDMPLRAGSRATLRPISREGIAIRRLRSAGAIILGKANMHELAFGITGENPWTGDVRNPHDESRQSGGSSSGSAVAVATGIGLASVGTDTGGSIRIPASYCGVVGFKPTRGLIRTSGITPLSPSCDHIGPLTKSIWDARLLTETMAGRRLQAERLDAAPVLWVPRRFLRDRLTADMQAAFQDLIVKAGRAGASIKEISVPALDTALDVYSLIVRAEAAALHCSNPANTPSGLSPALAEQLSLGRRIAACDYLDAKRRQQDLTNALIGVFNKQTQGAIVLPSAAGAAPLRGSTCVRLTTRTASNREAQMSLTVPFSLAGLPVLSMPFASAAHLPLGLQVVTGPNDDAKAFAIAEWLHRIT